MGGGERMRSREKGGQWEGEDAMGGGGCNG